jgi:hypothetical protein
MLAIGMSKRICKVFPLSKKEKILDLKKEKSHVEVAKIFGKNRSEIMKEKVFGLVLLLHLTSCGHSV